MTIPTLKYSLLALLLLGFTSPLLAQFEPLPTTSPGPHAAQVVGAPGHPIQDLFEVEFLSINGRNIGRRTDLWLEPGTYELQVAINADFTRGSRPTVTRRQAAGYNTIELELEAGKRYRVLARFHRSGEQAGGYSIILHRVDE